MRLQRLLVLFLLTAGLFPFRGWAQLSSLREMSIPVRADSVQLDTLSIAPGTFQLRTGSGEAVDSSAYRLDWVQGRLYWLRNAPAYKALTIDSVRARFRVFSFLFNNTVRHKDPQRIARGTGGAVNPFVYEPGAQEPMFFRSQGLQRSGTISRGITFGNNQDVFVNSSLNLQLGGKLNDNVEIVAAITDENIVIRGVTFDWEDLGSQGGTAHVIYIKRARNITITGVTVRGGASCVALLGCDNTLEQGNSYFDSENCLSDHWDNPRNAAVIGCYLEAGALRSISQMVNFNPEPSDLIGTGHVASGFIMTGCTVVSHEASSTQSQIEPLATGNYVERVNVTGNTWVNSYVVARGDVRGATFANNDFSGFLGTNAVIYCTDRFGVNPSALLVSNNIIRGALTTAPAEAVIVAQSVSALVQGNLIMGTGYTTSAITTVGAGGQILANYVEGTPVVGRLQGGARVINGTSSYWGWTDTNGSSPRMFLQSDDNWIWRSTGVGGTDRSVMSLQALSDTSEARWSVPNFFNNYTRQQVATVAAAGTTIGTATVLTANINNVSSATGGVADGVSLNPVDGQEQVVINTTAATINVYPNNNGAARIDGGGVGVPATILAGKSKTFVRVAASNFRTTAAT